MKRTVSVVSIIALLLVMLAGCAGNASTAKITGLAGGAAGGYTLGVGESAGIELAMTAEVTTGDGAVGAYTLAYGENGFAWPAGVDEATAAALEGWAGMNPVFESEDETVATVENGIIYGHRAGATAITASVTDPSGETVSLRLPVIVIQYAERLDVEQDSLELLLIEDAGEESAGDGQGAEQDEGAGESGAAPDAAGGNTAQIVAAVWPQGSTNSTVTFACGNEAVAKVDSRGNVRATGVGETEIIVTAPGGKVPLSHTIKVTVSVPVPAIFQVIQGEEEKAATAGKGFQFPLDIGEDSAENYNIVYTSSEESVATVTKGGWVDTHAQGVCEITAEIPQSSCAVTVVVTVQPAPAAPSGSGAASPAAGAPAPGGSGTNQQQRNSDAYGVAAAVVSQVTSGDMSQRQQADALNRWLFTSVAFMWDQSEEGYAVNFGNEAYGALVNRYAACSGFCRAYTMMLGILGIQSSHVNAGEWTHQWVEVYLADEGVWITVDPASGTFDGYWYSWEGIQGL